MECAASTVSILQCWAKFSFDTPDWPNSAAFWCINYWNASLTYSMRFSLCGALLCATLDTNTLDGFTTPITNANHTSDSTHAHSMLCPFPSDFTEHPRSMFHVWFVIVHTVFPLPPTLTITSLMFVPIYWHLCISMCATSLRNCLHGSQMQIMTLKYQSITISKVPCS